MNSVSFNGVSTNGLQNTKKEVAKGALIGAGVGAAMGTPVIVGNYIGLKKVSAMNKNLLSSTKKLYNTLRSYCDQTKGILSANPTPEQLKHIDSFDIEGVKKLWDATEKTLKSFEKSIKERKTGIKSGITISAVAALTFAAIGGLVKYYSSKKENNNDVIKQLLNTQKAA